MMKFENKNSASWSKAQSDVNLEKKDTIDNDLLEEEYEFNHHKANLIHTTFNSWKLFFGVALLAGPHAYSQSGLIGGIFGVAFGKYLRWFYSLIWIK